MPAAAGWPTQVREAVSVDFQYRNRSKALPGAKGIVEVPSRIQDYPQRHDCKRDAARTSAVIVAADELSERNGAATHSGILDTKGTAKGALTADPSFRVPS
jgi:hypothetical protein